MRSVDGEGTTIDEAIDRALVALGVAREEAEIEIVENANRGLFGIGRKKARVRATIRAPLEVWLDADSDASGGSAVALAPEREPTEASPGEVRHTRGARRSTRPSEPRATRPAPVHTPQAKDVAEQMRPVESRAETPLDGRATFESARVLNEILTLMAVEATVKESEEGVLKVEGPESAAAVGRRGEVLDALEYLVNRMAERAGHTTRVVLDADEHRAKRRASLEELSHRLAERARRRGKPVTLNTLTPTDRRTVYLALQSERGIVARSVGQGFYRKLVIIPEGGRRGGGKAAR